MADRIQQRRDTAARWAQYNPILLEGEVGYELDTDQYKVGDGIHNWNSLPYRGYSCLDQLGNSSTTPISQKVSTEEIRKRKSSFFSDDARKISKNFDGIIDIWLESGTLPEDTDLWLWYLAQPDTQDDYTQALYVMPTDEQLDPFGKQWSANSSSKILNAYIGEGTKSNPSEIRNDFQNIICGLYPSNPDPGFRLGFTIDWSKVNDSNAEATRYAKLDKTAILESTERRNRIKDISRRAISREQFFLNNDYPDSNVDYSYPILNIKPNSDPRGMFPYGIGLWYLSKGDGVSDRPTIYIVKCDSNGALIKSGNGIVAVWQPDYDSLNPYGPMTGIQTVNVRGNVESEKPYAYGFLDFDFTIDWDKVEKTEIIFDLKFNDDFFAQFFDNPIKDYGNKISILHGKELYDVNNPNPSFLIYERGEYGINVDKTLRYSNLIWNDGKVWNNSASEETEYKSDNNLMSYSVPIAIPSGIRKIKAVVVLSSKICHAFLDSSGTPIEFFGNNGTGTWFQPEYREFDVPIGAVSVSFSWTNEKFGYTNSFMCHISQNFINLGNWDTLPWLNKNCHWSYKTQQLLSDDTFRTTDLIETQGVSLISAPMVPGNDYGMAFFDKNKKLIRVYKGIETGGDNWETSTGVWIVPAGAVYFSHSYWEEYKDKFVIKEGGWKFITLDRNELVLASFDYINGTFVFQNIISNDKENLFDILNNLPAIPPQLFLRSDKDIPLYKNSLFIKFDGLYKVNVNFKNTDDAENGRRIFEILEPTYFNIKDFKNSGQIFLQRTNDYSKLFFKDVKVFSKDVSTLSGKTVSVLSLGDSLTEGLEWKNTPVTMLATELEKLGVTTKFIGSLARNYINPNGSQITKINYEGHGGWRYRTLVGLESQFAGLNVVIPSDPNKSEWVLGVDGTTMDEIKANNPFLYPATEQDKRENPSFCFHFITGNTSYNQSYSDNPNLIDYVIFDPVRYFSERNIEIPDVLTIAFGTNEWYLNVYGGFDLNKATDCAEFIFKQFRKVSSTMNIVVIPLNNLPTTRQEAWETAALPLCANVMRVVENMINSGDSHIFVCPIYAQGSRWLAYNDFIGAASDVSATNSLKQRTMDANVHMLYVDDDSNKDYADSLTACVVNLIE